MALAQPDCPDAKPAITSVHAGTFNSYEGARAACRAVMGQDPSLGQLSCESTAGNSPLFKLNISCKPEPEKYWGFNYSIWYEFWYNPGCGGRGTDSTGQCNDDGGEDQGDSCSDVSNPINPINGNKHQTELDFISSIGSLPLKIERTYNSWTAEYGIFGRNWTSNISVNSSIDVSQGSAAIRLLDGRLLTFSYNGTTWDSLNRQGYQLLENGSLFTLKTKAGEQYVFNSTGRLVQQADVYKHTLTYGYNPSGDLLETITDHYGNDLSITYYPQTTLVETITVMGRVFTYYYDSVEYANVKDAKLMSVAYPADSGTVSRTYVYKDTTDTRTQFMLEGIVDETGTQYVSWNYDSWGFAYRGQKSGDTEAFAIIHSTINDPIDPYVTVRNPLLGRTKLHLREGNNGRKQVKWHQGVAATATGCRAAGKHMTFDTDDLIVAYTEDLGADGAGVDGPGVVIAREFDSDGRVITETTGYKWLNDSVEYEVTDYAELLSKLVVTNEMSKVVTVWHPTLGNKKTKTTYSGKTAASGGMSAYRVENYTYKTNGRIESITHTDNTQIIVPYSTNGRVRTWTYSYEYHDLDKTKLATVTVDGPRTGLIDTVKTTYDDSGRIIKAENGLGHETAYSAHIPSGAPGLVTDTNGVASSIGYDARDRIATITSAVGKSIETINKIDYYAHGLVKRTTVALGTVDESWINYTYNGAHQLIRIENSIGDYIVLTPSDLDGRWQELKFYDSSGTLAKSQERVFDLLGRVKDVLYSDSSNKIYKQYDEHDNIYSTTLGANTATEVIRLYDTLSRLTQVNHADSGISTYEYDVQGNLTKVVDQRDLVTIYVYDGFGQLIQKTSPDTGITSYWYDEASNRTKKMDARNVETSYVYDALNRLTNVNYPSDNNKSVVYDYDDVSGGGYNIGRLSAMTDESGSTSYLYNALGQVFIKQNTIQGVNYTWFYMYDFSGGLASMVHPNGRVVNSYRDGVGRITEVNTIAWEGLSPQTVLSNGQYSPFGPLNSFDYGNGVTQILDHDKDYRLDISISSGTSTFFERDIDYNPEGNIETITDSLDPARSQSFTYDNASRLDVASGIYGDLDYDYDLVGNREKLTVGTSTLVEDYTYSEQGGVAQSNQLDSIASTPGSAYTGFNYNESGNLIYDPRSSLTLNYNAADRLEGVNSGVAAAYYIYNGLGQRVIKITATPAIEYTQFHYDEAGRLLLETDGYGRAKREYIYADDIRVAVITPNTADDTDSDGLDDDWELQYFDDLSRDGSGDLDGDGAIDRDEYTFGTEPGVVNITDADKDGLDDSWELQYFSNLDQFSEDDFDADGISDLEEYIRGTNPTQNIGWLVPVIMSML